ncbi:MAG: hypothetical protein GY712_03655, partial [Oceanicoccus sp.]|uniref:hypothetical protein n=1 Tax=Oceanicoccus sp. TaxID=2691044 RepID=UPI0026290AFB
MSAQTVTKQLYLSTDGSGSPDQDLDRIDPVNTSDGTTATSETLTNLTSVYFETATEASTGGSTLSFSHTFGGSIDPLLVVGIAYRDGSGGDINSVTFNGTNLTRLISEYQSGFKGYSDIWYLPPGSNPGSSTTANVVINGGGSPEGLYAVAANFFNVHQSTPLGSPNGNNGESSSASVSVSSVGSDDLVIDMVSVENAGGVSVGSGQTLIHSGTGGGKVSGGMSRETGSGSVTMSWSASSPKWAITAVAIKPASTTANPTTTFTQTSSMCSDLDLPSGGTITADLYLNVLAGTVNGSSNITAVMKYGGTTIANLTNAGYTGGSNGTLTLSGTTASAITVPAGQAIELEVTNNELLIVLTIQYDSQTKPSKIEFPTSTYIDITSYAVYDAAYPGGSITTIEIPGTTVYPRAVVSDPFGFSDITALNIDISGTPTAATSVATSACTRTYELAWTPGASGTYSIPATAEEGYEGTVTDVQSLSFFICTVIGTPVFTLGATSTRCQGAGSVTYDATSTNSTGMTYSLDAASITGGNTINSTTGEVTYDASWSGTTTIT